MTSSDLTREGNSSVQQQPVDSVLSNDREASDLVEGGLYTSRFRESARREYWVGSSSTHLHRLEIRCHFHDGESLVFLSNLLKLLGSCRVSHSGDDVVEETLGEKSHNSVESNSIR